ncbi:MAG: hypothetical protein NC335_00455 [Bacteroides sp.]|nr:hypothetical protein [Bacteroides sp.]
MDIYTSKYELIKISDTPLASGGEGEVREILSAPAQYKGTCAKIYYQQKRTPQQAGKIKYMANNPPAKVKGGGFLIGWPVECITDKNGAFLGFLMPQAFPNSKQLVNLVAPKLNKKLPDEWFMRYDRGNGKYALISRLKLICNISIPIHLLHSTRRYVLKDFKPENVLITHDGKVTIVDMDSVQISENGKLLYPGTAATANYIPPEFYKQGVGKNKGDLLTLSWDRFALGVVFYQLLFGLHPYVVTPYVSCASDTNEIFQNISNDLFPFGSNTNKIKSYPELHKKFTVLPPPVQRLFLRTFSLDSSNRPGADEWGKTIREIVLEAEKAHVPQPQPRPQPKPDPIPNNMIRCLECGELTDSIKRFTLPHIWLFLWCFISYQNIEYTCCPHCMRKHIFMKGFTYNILLANILWPFIILPWSIIQLIRSFSKGHSL